MYHFVSVYAISSNFSRTAFSACFAVRLWISVRVPIQPETVYDCPDGAPADYKITSVLGGAQSANAPPGSATTRSRAIPRAVNSGTVARSPGTSCRHVRA